MTDAAEHATEPAATEPAATEPADELANGPADASPPAAGLTFDDALAELQRVVAELEAGGQPLERSIALYERGVALHERCAGLLGDAELRVQQLVARAGGVLATSDIEAGDGSA